jgi:hypothetical protein
VCDQCGAVFAFRDGLSRHVRSRRPSRPSCNLFCPIRSSRTLTCFSSPPPPSVAGEASPHECEKLPVRRAGLHSAAFQAARASEKTQKLGARPSRRGTGGQQVGRRRWCRKWQRFRWKRGTWRGRGTVALFHSRGPVAWNRPSPTTCVCSRDVCCHLPACGRARRTFHSLARRTAPRLLHQLYLRRAWAEDIAAIGFPFNRVKTRGAECGLALDED